MGNTSIQTQSYRAVDKDAGQSRSYIIPFALLCSLFFLWAVANNLNDIFITSIPAGFYTDKFPGWPDPIGLLLWLFHYPNSCWDIDEKTQL